MWQLLDIPTAFVSMVGLNKRGVQVSHSYAAGYRYLWFAVRRYSMQYAGGSGLDRRTLRHGLVAVAVCLGWDYKRIVG